jgi:ribokinase
MDLVVRVGRLPVAGETVLGKEFLAVGGGKGANQAVAAARLGAQVSLVGCVGTDDYGRRLLSSARASGVSVRHVQRVSGPSGVAVIVVGDQGQNQIAVAPGANWQVTGETVTAARDLIGRAHALVAQLEVPTEAILAAALRAKVSGVPFILNAAPARTDIDQLLALTTVLVVNETELSLLAGQTVLEGREGDVAYRLLDRGPAAVLVTLGERGSVLVDRRNVRRVPAFPVQAVDATAAGDAFVGALAARFRGLDSLEEAARFASAAGAITCTRPGAQPSLPCTEEVESLLQKGAARKS